MLILRLAPLALLPLLACDNRATQQVNEPDAGPRSPSRDAGASNCPYPDGTCDFDSDCPADHRCEGAMHTTGVPHAFFCQGICVQSTKSPSSGTGSAGAPNGNLGCDPNGDPLQVFVAPEGSDRADAEADRAYAPLVATVKNCSDETYYRLVGCCGEGQPLVERLADDGSWQPVDCPAMPEVCCDAEPTCSSLAPGAGFDWPLPFFDSCECGAGTFRLRFVFSTEAGCIDDALGLTPIAVSASFVPHCY